MQVMLLGHSDSYVKDKAMQVTIAFNHFGEGLIQRMPRWIYELNTSILNQSLFVPIQQHYYALICIHFLLHILFCYPFATISMVLVSGAGMATSMLWTMTTPTGKCTPLAGALSLPSTARATATLLQQTHSPRRYCRYDVFANYLPWAIIPSLEAKK